MKYYILLIFVFYTFSLSAQNQQDKAIFINYDKGESYYYSTILSGVNSFDKEKKAAKPYKVYKVDLNEQKFPNKLSDYKNQIWHNKPISQGSTGTCWAFATTSFYESEAYRLSGEKVKLSEMYSVYWEYVAKALDFVESRGASRFTEGSEANAVTRMFDQHGIVPFEQYSGFLEGQDFYNHKVLFAEMNAYLQGVKKAQAWNPKVVEETIKFMLNKYMGTPPESVEVNGKTYTPKEYMLEVLKINPKDYVDILSYTQEPFFQQVEYHVPDNWWHSKVYYNVPLEAFFNALNALLKEGYTASIDADVSEAGLVNLKGSPQVALVPSFDIPSAYINDDARQFRFSNKTTTDDHLMHMVGSTKKQGHEWYLIKDSSSGSRNNSSEEASFGYYFFRDDYVKLKVMSYTVHKDAVKELLTRFEEVN
ncbi:MAG: peptidase C1 [Bacteroidetes bacterium 4572_77]|nr:MAG: peptidase C1 [Bacteroidetes bacterium 4572_77]